MQVLTPRDTIPDFVYCIISNQHFGLSEYGVKIPLHIDTIYKVNHNLGVAKGDVDLSLFHPSSNALSYGYLSKRFRVLYKNEVKLCKS